MKQICLIRDFPVIMYPEEYVRQSLLKECLLLVPKRLIQVERPIHDYGPTDLQLRADVVILDDEYKPYLVIECKEPSMVLTLQVKEQVMEYNMFIQAPFIAMTNGRQTMIFEQIDIGYRQLSLTSILDFLARKQYDYISETVIDRLTFEETQDLEYIDELISKGIISPVSDPKRQDFYAELYNALLTLPYVPTMRDLPIKIEYDVGYGLYGFGNASGKAGNFNFINRSFVVNVNDEPIPYRLSIVAAGVTKNHEVYGNRTGSTGLCVGIQEQRKDSYILELNLDKYSEFDKDMIHIFHNGIGSNLRKLEVMDTIRQLMPELVKGDFLYLGSFATNRSITTNELSELIENVIVYGTIRQKLKKSNKK
jgi:hypothetical protein